MNEGIEIRVHGSGMLRVPRSASYLSTYVLLEQEDWFEKEISFVRSLLKPGMRAIDVGANYGCYSVAMGRAVGPAGAVWLYEPTAATFGYLRHTLDSNELSWVNAQQLALSDHEGTGSLSVGDNSELNALGASAGGRTESVELTTLDRARALHSIDSVDFVKLDAEGEEVRIVAGAHEFFRSEDPLVMFEVKHGTALNVGLPSAFEGLGYRLYRLIGPDMLLVPAPHDLRQLDDFELNLFACKPGRAARLAATGSLIDAPIAAADRSAETAGATSTGIELWRGQPFAAAFGSTRTTADPLYARALDHYAAWRDESRPPSSRYAALDAALRELTELARHAPTLPRLFMLVRVAREAGARTLALQGLARILTAVTAAPHDLAEPCWPALERYDTVPPEGGAGGWLTASAVEAMVISSSFSGYFSGTSGLPLLDWLHASPYASAPMERRQQLQGIFSGRHQAIQGSALLQQSRADNLNPHLWAPGARLARGAA